MNIDLLINKTHDVGIVTTSKFESRVTAAIFDHQTHELSLEFGATMDSLALNIPVSFDFVPYLAQRGLLFFIGTDKTLIHEAYQIPLMHINDMAIENPNGEWA
jgi:hypothetical protein